MKTNKKLLKRIIDASLVSRHYFNYELLSAIINIKSHKKRKLSIKYYRWFIEYNDIYYLYEILNTLKIKICYEMVVSNLCIV